jgi:hypothetical protein
VGRGRRFPKLFTEVSASKLTNNFLMVQCISDTHLKEKILCNLPFGFRNKIPLFKSKLNPEII